MNIEKFTERARGFIQAAQTIAVREDNQRLTPEHLLKALLDDRLDIIATDHAPHTWEEKSNSYLKAPSGVPLAMAVHIPEVEMPQHR